MSRIPLFRRTATNSPLAALLISSVCFAAGLVGCGDQKDPSDALGGGDETSDETTTTKPDDTSVPDETQGNSSAPNTDEPVTDDSGAATTDSDGGEPTDTGGEPTEEPPASTGGGETSAPPPSNDGICPMAEGATWTYWHSSKGGWSETQTVTTGEYDGEPVFIVADTPDPEASLRSDSYIALKDGKLLRLYKEEFWVDPTNPNNVLPNATATYGVGFTRCNEAWADAEVGWSESPEYERVETPNGQAAKPAETRKHTFTVEGREDLTTDEGLSFTDCVKVRRSKDWAAVGVEDAEEKLYWFCPGVGKVREENVVSGNYEELTDYEIPE